MRSAPCLLEQSSLMRARTSRSRRVSGLCSEDEELADGHCIRCQVIGYLLALSLCFALHEINRVNPLALRAMSVVFNSVFNSAV